MNLYQQVNEIFNPNNARVVVRNIEQRQVIDLKPEDVVDVTEEGEDEIRMGHFTDDDYAAIIKQIEENNSGKGFKEFEECYEAKDFNLELNGTISHTASWTGDGYNSESICTEKIQIVINSFACRNAAGHVIPSDFDSTKIK